MTYLIALIIAIALGAVIALLSFVNIGSGFGNQSAAAKAQQFSQAGSQLEVAMAAYNADNAGSAFEQAATQDLAGTVDRLEADPSGDNWLKEAPVAPTGQGNLTLEQGTDGVYLLLSAPTDAVCDEINALGGYAKTDTTVTGVAADVEGNRLACEGTGGTNVAGFKVE
tara:strand:+ start:41401 stop:41904 length:504 start_codon:yes stop_codon:yes gene_type:complete